MSIRTISSKRQLVQVGLPKLGPSGVSTMSNSGRNFPLRPYNVNELLLRSGESME